MSAEQPTIFYTLTDEAPLLAGVEDSRALLPLAYNRRGRKMAFRA